ncbi:hypothetical protein V6N13_065587 [Hibiscus sabdariffa]|uniref:Uncharacterized protein n=1 Tax=Hibiscus sabdariffa TaxID=183260 RepID=A0ABR2QQF3_9ROSI
MDFDEQRRKDNAEAESRLYRGECIGLKLYCWLITDASFCDSNDKLQMKFHAPLSLMLLNVVYLDELCHGATL